MKLNFDQPKGTERVAINQENLNKAYQKALKILSEPIKPEDFGDIYKDVERDISFVNKKEKQYAEQAKAENLELQNRRKIATIFEAIIFEQIEQSNWFGETAVTIQTSRYDDIVHGVDTLVEFDENANASHLALALDVTTASRFSEKFTHIKGSIERGELAKIKYFKSGALTFRGEKSQIPHVVIGVDRETIFNLIGAWISGNKHALATHPAQIKILEEVRIQLEAFKLYAQKIGKDDIVRVYEKTLMIINKIVSEKGATDSDVQQAIGKDNFFTAIKKNAEEIAEGLSPSGFIAWD
jgi:arsenate reductase-like glutaredoxin family protein